LEEIVEHKRREIEGRRELLSLDKLRERPGVRGEPRSFRNALSAPGLSLIAEIKKASPSAGVLRADFDPASLAKTYQESGAAALSVLTDERWFQGRLEYLAVARNVCSLPILRKDFIVSTYQILEASRGGADAVLLIVAALEDGQLRDLREAAESEGLDALVEVHDEKELERAMRAGADMIGINNRNLRSLAVDLDVTERLLRRLTPEERARMKVVAESGVKSNADWKRLAELGVNAVLVGTTFMKAADVGAKVRELTGA
jgi:indole-3-glycerol phosphate synthase